MLSLTCILLLVTAAKMIHTHIEGVAYVDVDLELEGIFGGGEGQVPFGHIKGKVKKDDLGKSMVAIESGESKPAFIKPLPTKP
jgi:hypothetical protein